MKHCLVAFSIMLFLTTSASAQWQKIEEIAYSPTTLGKLSKFIEQGDTLYSLSGGDLYYSINNGVDVSVYEEKLILMQIAAIKNQVYVATKSELYKVDNGAFTLVGAVADEIDRITDFEGSIILIGRGGIYLKTEDGFVLNAPYEGFRAQQVGWVGNKLMFFAHSFSSKQYKVFYTTDGSSFSDLETLPYTISSTNKVAIFGGRIFIQSSSGITSSSDGVNWKTVTTGSANATLGTFIDLGDALIFGRAKARYNEAEYVYMAKGDSLFTEFPVDVELSEFGRFLYTFGNRIFMLNDAKDVVAYDLNQKTWSFVIAAPQDGQYFYVGESMILSASGGYEVHKKSFDDKYWSRTLKYIPPGSGYSITAVAELPSGRLIAGINGNGLLYYSDDKGNTWENDPSKPILPANKFIARNDTILAGSSNAVFMSTDNAETWIQVLNMVNAINIKFKGSNSIFADRQVYSLSDFSEVTSINTNDGTVQDYDTLNGYEYKGTALGLYNRVTGSSKWINLTGRLATGLTRTSVLGVISFKDVIIALSADGVYYTSNDGEIFKRAGNEIRSIRSYFVKEDTLYINAYSDLDKSFGLYKANMNQMDPLPVLETSFENEQFRADTLINLKVKALIQPRNFAVSVYFEYGEITKGDFVYTHSTTPKVYSAQEEPFEATGTIPQLDASIVNKPKRYKYRAALTYNDTTIVVGKGVSLTVRNKKLWNRLDPAELGGNFRDVFITRRGSIIAWGASGTIRSTNNGKNWRKLEQGNGIYSMIQTGGNRLIAGTTSGKFMYSITEGMTWELAENINLPGVFGGNNRVWDMTYDGSNSILYALIGEKEAATNNATYLIKSIDSGNNWTTLLTTSAPDGGRISDIHADSSGTLWVISDAPLANYNMIIKSTDFGETWESVLKTGEGEAGSANEMIQVGRDTLYVKTSMGGYYSVDGGTTFSFATDTDGNIISNTRIGNKYAFSGLHGLVSVANVPASKFESGLVSISSSKENSLDFVSARAVNYFGDSDEMDLRNNNMMIVRNAYVSRSDMVLIATNNGVWRYISSSDSLLVNPDPGDVAISNEEEIERARVFTLYQNYPNPFNPSTNISFQLPKEAEVTIKIYDITGREVTTLIDHKKLTSGAHTLTYNASHLASGMYLYKISAGKFSQVRKMTLIK